MRTSLLLGSLLLCRRRSLLKPKDTKKPPLKGAKSYLLEWAIEELNLGPHAYQACALTT